MNVSTAMLIVDNRACAEKEPTGVTRVAEQMLCASLALYPNAAIIRASDRFSNIATNAFLFSGALTLERLAHTTTPTVHLFLNFNFARTRRDSIVVQTVHDLSFAHAPYWYSPKMRLWHAAIGAIRRVRNSHILIAVSEFTKFDLVNYFNVPKKRIVVVPPATPNLLLPTRPHEWPIPDKRFFLFLGTLEKRKNIAGLIEAFSAAANTRELRDTHLVLAGRIGFGAPDVRSLPERVHFLPFVSESEKSWLYKNAIALVYPSFFEGFGLPPLEAASLGCPTIISNCGALREVLGDSAILISPYDLNHISMAMRALACDNDLRAEYIERGINRAQHFTFEQQKTALAKALAIAHEML